ncbi:MAG: 3-hydroxyacyl-CoA dehydrogenase NAD-binding domain-containing protein [Acidimicrobiales bacterium]
MSTPVSSSSSDSSATADAGRSIESVAVLGCGTMGAGIAAISAAAGCRVLMLDLNIEAAQKGAEIVEEEHRHLVEVGTFDNDIGKLAEFDWIVEVIVENLDIKRQLFEKVEANRADGSIISSNTSGIPLRDIAEGMGERFGSDVAITHFFNPPQLMKLFELVPGEDTADEVIKTLADFAADKLGKGVVYGKDTPNFIGNRVGCYFMLSALHKAKPYLADGMTQETIDAVLSHPVGLPPTGVYGLMDLIGLDVMDLVAKNLAANLAEGDAGLPCAEFPPAEQRMIERGQLGRKTGGGFSKVNKLEDGTRTKEIFDLTTEEWRPATEPDLEGVPGDLGEVLFTETQQGHLAWDIFGGGLCYAADLIPEISDDIVNVDRAMRWGFNWALGPFELLDAIGPARVIDKLRAEGAELPAMLAVLAESGADSFYRADGTEYLGLDGQWHSVS